MDRDKFYKAFETITFKQWEVLKRLLSGKTDLEISNELGIQPATVRKHVENIYRVFELSGEERRSRRSDLFTVFAQYKPELLKIDINSIVSRSRENENNSAANISNPFIPLAGPVDDRKLFFNRDREIDRVFQILNSGTSVALTGEKEIGKSSLLQMIKQQVFEKLNYYRKPIFLNMDNVFNEKEFYLALCDLIEIHECKGYHLYSNLNQQKNKFLLILEEAENFQLEYFSNNLRGQIKALTEEYNSPLKLVIAVDKPLNTLNKNFSDNGMISPFANISFEVKINPWQKDTIAAFVASRLDSNSIQFNEKEIKDIITKSKGYPRQVMKLCHQLYSSKRDIAED